MLADASFQNYYSDQIMEVEAMNLTTWYLAQKLVCLEDLQGANLMLCASAESATDKRFLQSLKENTTENILVACEPNTFETWTSTAGRLRIDVRSNHCYPKAFNLMS